MAYNKDSIVKYLSKLKEIRFRVKPEEYERFCQEAKKRGYESMRQFYLDAINEKIDRGK